MISKDVKRYIDENKIEDLYKLFIKVFDLIDTWAERFTQGDLLTEYELAHSMDVLSGCYGKLNSVAGALESILAESEHNVEVTEYNKLGDKCRTQDGSIVRAKARHSVADLRRFHSDFSRYCQSASILTVTAQSRLKRLTVEKTAKRLDHTGEVPNQNTNIEPTGW